jgi:hypothetical protein
MKQPKNDKEIKEGLKTLAEIIVKLYVQTYGNQSHQ